MAAKGREGFDQYYGAVYGERWEALRASLLLPTRQVARLNRFCDRGQALARPEVADRPLELFAGIETVRIPSPEQSAAESGVGTSDACEYESAAAANTDRAIDGSSKADESDESLNSSVEGRIRPQADGNGLFDFYIMDPASIFAARALGVQEGDEVLDLCAAPGGKTLILAESLAKGGRLVANEMSDRRRARLRAVLEDYLPSELRSRIGVSSHDGSRWCLHETEAFDRILVDAPCSGERHLLENPSELKIWSPARSKNLAVRQYALLTSALQVVRIGGRIVYSTCSISSLENDAVIARLLKKREGEARVIRREFEIGEATEHGWMIMPDRTGYGPIYFAILERLV